MTDHRVWRRLPQGDEPARSPLVRTAATNGNHVRKLAIESLAPGHVLAEDVRDASGGVLLRAGTTLTDTYIAALVRRGYSHIPVDDGIDGTVETDDPLSWEVRGEVARTVERMTQRVLETTLAKATDLAGSAPRSTDEITDRLGDDDLGVDEAHLAELERGVSALIAEVLDQPVLDGLFQLKGQSDYTYAHSVEVAAVGVAMGRRLRMDHRELRDLAVGCLLHDVGKSMIDSLIIDKAGPLTDAEFAEVQRHPELGYEIIRRLRLASVVPAHIARQHHERQDGGGYPAGLEGFNRVARRRAEQADPRRMMLSSEIAAVADVYSAISSDRPYRPAMAPSDAAAVLRDSAGAHLNREVVATLFASVPMLPRGTWVRMTAGPWDGWHGQVAAQRPPDWDRPVVRMLLDPRGEQPAEAFAEVDTSADSRHRFAALSDREAPDVTASPTGATVSR